MGDVNVTRVEEKAEQTQLAERSVGALSWATALIVSNDAELVEASDTLRGLKTVRLRINEVFDPPIAAAHASHKAAIAAKKKVDGPLAEAEGTAKGKIGAYQLEQEKKRREEQRQREEVARKEAEELRLREAEALEAQGQLDEADMVLEQPVAVPVVAAVPPPPKVEGVKMTKRWRFEIITPNLVPRELCVPNDALIRERLRSTSGIAIPGVRAWQEGSVSVEAKR